ncbi:cell division protein FtsA [Atopobacter phocae]|uniref:cell division protein FtsA n=1 Tax=Atopobacter phocae TaxID=136492 RepID=UPI00046FEA43|nr:cell division protein FtsA [Atopobacter phocae]
MNQQIYVSLDIGTTAIKVVVAEYVKGQINVIGVGSEPSRGVSRGVIVDIDETVRAIELAVRQAEQKSGVTIRDVYVGIPSNQIQIEPCHGMIAVSSENREITDKDVFNVIAAAKVRSVAPERDIISVLPDEFIVDGFDGIKDPRGMIGVRLELNANLITGPRTIIHNVRRSVEKAGLKIIDLIVQPLASAHVALSDGEREFGTVLLDMGGGQTSVSVFHDQLMKFSFVDQEGGEFVTRDISIILNTSLNNAERIKREYGYAVSSDTSDKEFFPVDTIGQNEPVQVDEHYLSEIIEARLVQIFQTIKRALDEVDALKLPGGIVISGGAASLPGIIPLAESIFGVTVKPYMPDYIGLRHPSFTSSVGLVKYATNLGEIDHIAEQSNAPKEIVKQNAPRPAKRRIPIEPKNKPLEPKRVVEEKKATTKEPQKHEIAKQIANENGFIYKVQGLLKKVTNFFKSIIEE